MTYQIIYSSESSTPMQQDELEEILDHARRRNAAVGITGALVYVDGVFLQILEGDKGDVQDLMTKIARDVRHETVVVFREAEVPVAVFRDWDMAFVSATAEQIASWAGFSGPADGTETVTGSGQDPDRAAQVAQRILSVLVAQDTGQQKPTDSH